MSFGRVGRILRLLNFIRKIGFNTIVGVIILRILLILRKQTLLLCKQYNVRWNVTVQNISYAQPLASGLMSLVPVTDTLNTLLELARVVAREQNRVTSDSFVVRLRNLFGLPTTYVVPHLPTLTGKAGTVDFLDNGSVVTLSRRGERVTWQPVRPDIQSFSYLVGHETSVRRRKFDDDSDLALFNVVDFKPTGLLTLCDTSFRVDEPDYFYTKTKDVVARVSPDGKNLDMLAVGTSRSYSISLETAVCASIRYNLAKSPALGIVSTVCGPSVDQVTVSLLMSIIANSDFHQRRCLSVPPSMAFLSLYSDEDPTDAKEMNVREVCNVVYPSGGLGYGAPLISRGNEYDTVARRIVLPSVSFTGNPQVEAFAGEFLDRLCKEELVPCTHDEVVEQMGRPSQKQNRESVYPTMDLLWSRAKQLFTKSEPVEVGKPGRNITTLSPERLYRACGFMMSLANYMKRTQPWWVWGVGGGGTSAKYHRVCQKYDKVAESDFTKFDASRSEFFVSFDRSLMRRFFPQYFDEWSKLEADVLYQKGVTRCGMKFDLGHGMYSGSNETTNFNTINQGFVQYVAFRLAGKSADEAWELICDALYGGDDGLTPYVGQSLEAAAAVFGMKVEVRVFDSSTPCRFLGRIYPSGRNSPDSFQDIAAFIKTIHLVSLGSENSVEQGLVNAANGLAVTDRRTPLLCDFIDSVFRAYPKHRRCFLDADRWWLEKYDRGDPFRLEDYTDEASIFSWTAQDLKVPVDDVYRLRDWLRNNDFTVGSLLPEMSVSEVFAPKSAIQIFGVPLGTVAPKPELPSISSAAVAHNLREIDRVERNISRICYNCRESGHLAANCPKKLQCKICGLFAHTADKCTEVEEKAADALLRAQEDVDLMVGAPVAAASGKREHKGSRKRRGGSIPSQ